MFSIFPQQSLHFEMNKCPTEQQEYLHDPPLLACGRESEFKSSTRFNITSILWSCGPFRNGLGWRAVRASV